MAVHSNTFGGLHLTGEDAKKFRRQVRSGRSSEAAKTTASNGVSSAIALLKKGEVKVAKATG